MIVRRNYTAGATRIAMREGNGTGTTGLTWILGDHLGSTSITVNAETPTQVTSRLLYKPWGETRYASGTTPTTYRYTGQRAEPDLGIYYYGARWYDPAIGRFISPDSIIPGAGNPLAWDRYAYGNNNPLMYIDPTGHSSEEPDDFELDEDTIKNLLAKEYKWKTSGKFTTEQLIILWRAGGLLRNYVSDVRGENSDDFMQNYFEEITFTQGALISKVLNSNNAPGTNTINLMKDFDSIWWEQGTSGMVIHEMGHTLDNRIGNNKGSPLPAVFDGGGPADALYEFMGGSYYGGVRFLGGVSFPEAPENAFSKYPYGNHSSADYFAHSLSISVVDRPQVPPAAAMWMSSFIGLLP